MTDSRTLKAWEHGVVAVDETGRIEGVYAQIPAHLSGAAVVDFGDSLLLPGYVDLHLHAAQVPSRGLGYEDPDNWFASTTGPVEAAYSTDLAYAKKLNRRLVQRLWDYGIIRSAVFSTHMLDATKDLMECFDRSGLSAYVGKMNSDDAWFSPAHEETAVSAADTYALVEAYGSRDQDARVRLILSPEFIPCCSKEILSLLGKMAAKYNLPVQSHMGESLADTGTVAERYDGKTYAEVYREFGLLGQTPTLMAHCLYVEDKEIELLAKSGTYVVHCPHSNLNVPSGRLMQLRRFLDAGIKVGLGSDIGGGHTLSMPQNIVAATQVSKQLDGKNAVGTLEAYYLATKGGGSFFGKTGSLEPGYWFDAIVVDDSALDDFRPRSLQERLLRYLYGDDCCPILSRFCMGQEISRPE